MHVQSALCAPKNECDYDAHKKWHTVAHYLHTIGALVNISSRSICAQYRDMVFVLLI